MSKTAVVTARIDPATLATLDEVARAQDRSRAWVVAEAVAQYAERWEAYEAFVQEGIDAATRGDLVSQDKMEDWFEARRRPIAAE